MSKNIYSIAALVLIFLISAILASSFLFITQKCIALYTDQESTNKNDPIAFQIGELTSMALLAKSMTDRGLAAVEQSEINPILNENRIMIENTQGLLKNLQDFSGLGTKNIDPARFNQSVDKFEKAFSDIQSSISKLLKKINKKLNLATASDKTFESFNREREKLIYYIDQLTFLSETAFDEVMAESEAIIESKDLARTQTSLLKLVKEDYPMLFASLQLKSDVNSLNSLIVFLLRTEEPKALGDIRNRYLSQFSRIEFNLEELIQSYNSGKEIEQISRILETLRTINDLAIADEGIFSKRQVNIEREKEIENRYKELQSDIDFLLNEINSLQLSLSY